MINKIEEIRTDNIPLLDELVYNLKKIVLSCVLKDEQKALKYETLESQKLSDKYIACIEGRSTLMMFDYTLNDLQSVGVPLYLQDKCMEDYKNIPENFRKPLIQMKTENFINNYSELNLYYRTLFGLPPVGEKGIKITLDYLQPDLYDIIDVSKELHNMSESELDILYTFNIMNKVIEENPGKLYLNYMGSKRIPIYDARKAQQFELLYVTPDVPKEILIRFKEKIELNRIYTLKTIYTDAFKIGSDYYDNFIAILILVETMKDIIVELPDFIIKKEIFDIRMIQLLFKSNGVDFFEEIPFRYQLAMVRNLNRLIKFKSTTKNIVDICSLFGFDNIQVFKYFLLKDRKTTELGEYLFNTKEVENEDGSVSTVEDVEKNFDLRFIKVPIDGIADNYIHDKSKFLDYDEIVEGDKYWNGDLPHDYVKKSILDREFNYIQSKYISIDTIYSLTELSFQMIYFYNIIFDQYKLEEQLFLRIPMVNSYSKFKFVDVMCYLYALMYEYNGIVDDLMDTPTKVLHVKGFNFKTNMAELSKYVAEQGFTMEELGVDGFIIPESQILSYNQLINIYLKNKSIHDHIVNQLYKADNKKIYDIYMKIYDSLMITDLNMEFFKKKNGEVAKTYTEFLLDRNVILYHSLTDIRNIESVKVKREKIANIIDACIYAIEQYIEGDEFKFIFSFLPSVSAEAVKKYIYKVINFFKSYKVDIMGINTIYKFDDRLENKIKMIDEILIKYVYTKQSTIDIISKLKTTSMLDKKERIELMDKLYIEITFWLDLFFNTTIKYNDKLEDIVATVLKNSDLHIRDYTQNLTTVFDSKKSFLEYYSKIDSYNISTQKKDKIELHENIYFEVTYWLSKFLNSDIQFKELLVTTSEFIFKQNIDIHEDIHMKGDYTFGDVFKLKENISTTAIHEIKDSNTIKDKITITSYI